MTFGEFREKELDCNECPIANAELCGYSVCKEFNRDPPCSFEEDNVDMNEWIKAKNDQIFKIESLEQKKIKKKKELSDQVVFWKNEISLLKQILSKGNDGVVLAQLQVARENLDRALKEFNSYHVVL